MSNDTLPEIDGIEQVDQPPAGSTPFATIYYRDKAQELTATALALPVRENHCIAPRVGWPKRIYRKPDTLGRLSPRKTRKARKNP